MNQALVKKQQMEYLSLVILFLSCIMFRIQVGDIGIGYLLTAYLLYEIVWVIFGKNFSDTVGRILKNKYAKGKNKAARLVWKYSFSMQLVTGVVFGIIISVVGSLILSRGFGFLHSYFLIWFLGPTFMIRMVSESFAGYISGRNYELAAGFASIIRYTIVFVMGLVLSSTVKEYGKKVAALLKQDDFASVYGNVGILISVVVAEIIVLIFLMIIRLGVKRTTSEFDDDFYQKNDNNGNVFTGIWKRRFVDGINLLFMFSPMIILFFVFKNYFADGVELSQNLGLIVGTIGAPCALFVMVGFLISLPLASKTFRFAKKKEMKKARTVFHAGFHLSVIYSVFGASFLIAEANILSQLLSAEHAADIYSLYNYGAFCIIAATLAIYMLRVLIMNGEALLGLLVEIVSTVIFGVFINLFIKGGMNILMAIMVSTLIFFVLQAIAYSVIAIFKLDMQIDPVSSLFIPVVVGVICGALNWLIAKFVAPHLGNLFTLLFSFVEMLVLYMILLLMFRNFKERELEHIPGNKLIRALGQMMHIL